MSELSATNCGCGCNEGNGFGNNSCLWIILLLFCCGNGFGGNNGCGNGCGGGNDCCLIILLLLFCCGNGCNSIGNNGGCGCC